jgi:hypothetical protein
LLQCGKETLYFEKLWLNMQAYKLKIRGFSKEEFYLFIFSWDYPFKLSYLLYTLDSGRIMGWAGLYAHNFMSTVDFFW